MATPRILNVAGGQQVYNKEKIDEIIEQLAGDVDPATLASNVMERLDAMDQAIANANQATTERLDAMDQTIADALAGNMPSASDSDIDDIWGN